jgi:hypothetical protein
LSSGQPAIASGGNDGDVAHTTPNPSSMAKSVVFRKSEIDACLKSSDPKNKGLTNGQAEDASEQDGTT